uniref:Uncharacterized protein n=1 Tax=Anguilla anguilla TaxID=7936 RepID=A0A0E9WBZ4_ANGAN
MTHELLITAAILASRGRFEFPLFRISGQITIMYF